MHKKSGLTVIILFLLVLAGCSANGEQNSGQDSQQVNLNIVEPGVPIDKPYFSNDLIYTIRSTEQLDSTIELTVLALNLDWDEVNRYVISIPSTGELQSTSIAVDSAGLLWSVFHLTNDTVSSYWLANADGAIKELTFMDDTLEDTLIDMIIDDDDHFCIATDTGIYITNSQGLEDYRLNVYVQDVALTVDNQLCVSYYAAEDKMEIRTLDIATGKWDQILQLGSICTGLLSGAYNYDFLYYNNTGVYGFDKTTEELVFSWSSLSIAGYDLYSIVALDNDTIVCSLTYDIYELLQITHETPEKEKQPINLATYNLSLELYDTLLAFSRHSPDYYVNIIDYIQYDTDSDSCEGLVKLTHDLYDENSDIDIVDLKFINTSELVRDELLVDMYTLLDADEELSRESLTQELLSKLEISDGLYELSTQLTIETITTSTTSKTSDNLDFTSLTQYSSEPFVYGLQGHFLSLYSQHFYDELISENGEINEDTFSALLQFCETLPKDDLSSSMQVSTEEMRQRPYAITSLDNFCMRQFYLALADGDLAYIGYPSNGSGTRLSREYAIGITSNAADLNGAWEVARILITEEFQTRSTTFGFPTNQTAFDQKRSEEQRITPITQMGIYDFETEIGPATDQDVEDTLYLLDIADGVSRYNAYVCDIILRNGQAFFSGEFDIEQTITAISDEVEIYYLRGE